jgi:hypothetical protein
VEKTVINRLLDFCGVPDNFEINFRYIIKQLVKNVKYKTNFCDIFRLEGKDKGAR